MLSRVFNPAHFTGWHMVGVLGLFFGTIILVNATLAVFATGTWTGLVVENSYVASQHYNEKLEAAEAQTARGWQDSLAYSNDRLSFTLRDAEGAPIMAERVTATIGRPAYEALDHELILGATSPGHYAAQDVLAPGYWDVTVRATTAAGQDWHLTYRLQIDAEAQ
jgi:nitrogen fixation protein FixH